MCYECQLTYPRSSPSQLEGWGHVRLCMKVNDTIANAASPPYSIERFLTEKCSILESVQYQLWTIGYSIATGAGLNRQARSCSNICYY